MIRNTFNLLTAASLFCLLVAGSAMADCAECGAGCDAGGCVTSNGGGGLLGKRGCSSCVGNGVGIYGGGCVGGCRGNGHCRGGHGGNCVTCDHIWDDYCSNKSDCLPFMRHPVIGGRGHGHCNGHGCAKTSGHGGCAVGTAGCKSGHHGGGLLSRLFAPCSKRASSACDGGACDAPGCADATCDAPGCAAPTCDAAGGCSAPATAAGACTGCAAPAYAPAPMMGQPTPVEPAMEPAPRVTPPLQDPSAPPAPTPAGSASRVNVMRPSPVPPLPPAPAITDQTRTGSFDWLQRALRLN